MIFLGMSDKHINTKHWVIFLSQRTMFFYQFFVCHSLIKLPFRILYMFISIFKVVFLTYFSHKRCFHLERYSSKKRTFPQPPRNIKFGTCLSNNTPTQKRELPRRQLSIYSNTAPCLHIHNNNQGIC